MPGARIVLVVHFITKTLVNIVIMQLKTEGFLGDVMTVEPLKEKGASRTCL